MTTTRYLKIGDYEIYPSFIRTIKCRGLNPYDEYVFEFESCCGCFTLGFSPEFIPQIAKVLNVTENQLKPFDRMKTSTRKIACRTIQYKNLGIGFGNLLYNVWWIAGLNRKNFSSLISDFGMEEENFYPHLNEQVIKLANVDRQIKSEYSNLEYHQKRIKKAEKDLFRLEHEKRVLLGEVEK